MSGGTGLQTRKALLALGLTPEVVEAVLDPAAPGGPVTTDDVSVEGTYNTFEGDDLTSVLFSIDTTFDLLSGVLEAMQADAVTDVDPPEEATAEDVANKLNDLLASLRAAGLLAEIG